MSVESDKEKTGLPIHSFGTQFLLHFTRVLVLDRPFPCCSLSLSLPCHLPGLIHAFSYESSVSTLHIADLLSFKHFPPGNGFLLVVQMPDFSSSGLLNTNDPGAPTSDLSSLLSSHLPSTFSLPPSLFNSVPTTTLPLQVSHGINWNYVHFISGMFTTHV